MMKSLNINHLSGLKENMLITTSDKLISLSVKSVVQKGWWLVALLCFHLVKVQIMKHASINFIPTHAHMCLQIDK